MAGFRYGSNHPTGQSAGPRGIFRLARSGRGGKKQDSQKELEILAEEILKNESISYGDFTNQFMELAKKSEASAKRAVKSLTESGFIEKYQGNYRLKIPNKENEANDDCGDMNP